MNKNRFLILMIILLVVGLWYLRDDRSAFFLSANQESQFENQGLVPVLIQDKGETTVVYIKLNQDLRYSLLEAGVVIYPEDILKEFVRADLGIGAIIEINRAHQINLIDAGTKKIFRTQNKTATIKEFLSEIGLVLAPDDKIQPKLGTFLKNNLKIVITRVKKIEKEEKEIIPFQVQRLASETIYRGEERMVQAGRNGLKKVRYLLHYENGQLIEKKKISEMVVETVQHKIIWYGTKIKTRLVGYGIGTWYRTVSHLATCNLVPAGTRLLVTNLNNGRSVEVINQGGGLYTSAIIDLSRQAFERLGAPASQGKLLNLKVERILN